VKKSKPASSASKPKLVLEKSAGAIVYSPGTPVEYLLLRSRHWEFPKGLIDADESELDAAAREVREETGLEVDLVPGFRESIQYFYRRGKGGALVKKEVIYFLGKARERAFKISWEHQEARWVTLEQAMELLEYENYRGMLTKANEIVMA
jgi:8-oxo-dGTP pyrophosphatase MutT (NUDIX family)